MRTFIKGTAASWLLALIVAAMIIAADIRFGHAATGGVAVDQFVSALMPYLVAVVGALIAWLVGLAMAAMNKLLKKWGLDIEARHRDALQTTATNAGIEVVRIAAQELGERAKDIRIPLGSRFTEIGVQYMLNGAGDAIKFFGLTPAGVAEKLAPKVAAAQAMVTPIVGPSFPPAPAVPAGVAPDTGRIEMSGRAG